MSKVDWEFKIHTLTSMQIVNCPEYDISAKKTPVVFQEIAAYPKNGWNPILRDQIDEDRQTMLEWCLDTIGDRYDFNGNMIWTWAFDRYLFVDPQHVVMFLLRFKGQI